MSGTGYKTVNKMDKISAFVGRGEDVHTHAKQIRILGRDTGLIEIIEKGTKGLGEGVWLGKGHWSRKMGPGSGGAGRVNGQGKGLEAGLGLVP